MVPVTTAKPTRRTQQERTAQTREALLLAARAVFGREGFTGARLDDIAAEAGVTKGALYHHFDGKEDLFLELLDERCQARQEDIREVFKGDEDLLSQARIAASHQQQAARENAEWNRLFFEFAAYAARDPRFAKEFEKRVGQMRATLTEIVKDRVDSLGLELSLSAENIALAINAIGNGLALERMARPDAVPDELLGTVLNTFFVGLIAATPDGQKALGQIFDFDAGGTS